MRIDIFWALFKKYTTYKTHNFDILYFHVTPRKVQLRTGRTDLNYINTEKF